MSSDVTPYANNIFEQPWWLDAVAGDWDEIVVQDNGTVIGRLPVCYGKNRKRIELPPLTQTCGVWLKTDSGLSHSEQCNQIKDVIERLLEQIPASLSIDIALNSSLQYFLPFYWKGFSIRPRISYRIEDLTNLDTVYQNFARNIKRDIKNAEKKLSVLEDASADILIDIMEKTFAAQGRRYPISHQVIRNIMAESLNHDAGKMFYAVDNDGNIHASAYFVYDKHTFYYLLGGKDSKFKNSNAQTLILWKAIQYASTVSEVFDFEGSMVEGIETFFRRFGSTPVIYYEVKRQSFLNELKDICKPRLKRLLGYKI